LIRLTVRPMIPHVLSSRVHPNASRKETMPILQCLLRRAVMSLVVAATLTLAVLAYQQRAIDVHQGRHGNLVYAACPPENFQT
jgi:hypothetical protein